MFLKRRITILAVALLVIAGYTSCEKKWDEHVQSGDEAVTNSLMTAIQASPNLSKFAELLVKSGYDKVISSSKTYTVWAPSDAALATLDPAIIADSAKLKLFVANHISNQSFLTGAERRVKMLNNKFNTFTATRFDSANITTANLYAGNGVYHVIDKFVPRLDNIWEFINTTTEAPMMKAFLLSLNRTVFDPTNATQIGVDPLTGLPKYDTATGLVTRNYFLDSVLNVSDESRQFTMILLTDAAYTTEFNKLKPWFKTSSADSTNRLTGSWLVKDLAISGLYQVNQLPDTLLSEDGVKVPINKTAIKATYKVSNGIVYVMDQVNFTLAHKFPPIIIEGENPTAFSLDRSANTFYRLRYNPLTGLDFKDILLTNYNVASYNILYRLNNVPSMRYDAYWVAVNDLQATPLWSQRLGIDSVNNINNLPAKQIQYRNYNEVLLGQLNILNYRRVNLYVIGPTTASTSGNANAIVLDYIKLVPAF